MNYLEVELLVQTRLERLYAEAERNRLLAQCGGGRPSLLAGIGLGVRRLGLLLAWLTRRGAAWAGRPRAEAQRAGSAGGDVGLAAAGTRTR